MVSTGLLSIQKDDFTNLRYITRLFLSHNELRTIPPNVFQYTNSLEIIDLSNNVITTIEDFAFNGLENLQRVHLINNSITDLDRDTFAGANNLKWLDLARNKIDSIEDGTFKLPNLQYLFLSHNRIHRLSNSLFSGASNLMMIHLENNSLTRIGRAFTGLNNLSRVYLDDNYVEDFKLVDFVGQEELSLKNTSLQLNQLGRWPNVSSPLIYLDVSQNGWSASDILTRLSFFSNLEILDLTDNNFSEIDRIDEAKGLFPKLEKLELNGNKFTCKKIFPIVDKLRSLGINFQKTISSISTAKNYAGVSCV